MISTVKNFEWIKTVEINKRKQLLNDKDKVVNILQIKNVKDKLFYLWPM